MWSRIVFCVVLLVTKYAADADFLEPLPGGALLTGTARVCPVPSSFVDVVNHQGEFVEARATEFHKPSLALRSGVFSRYVFTAYPAALLLPLIGVQDNFLFTQLEYTFNDVDTRVLALQLSSQQDGERGYWVPQGGYMDIPARPRKDEPHFVFTPNFSGCSLTVTSCREGRRDMFRVRHVEGGKEDSQFNSLPADQKKGDVTYAMQYKDYGYCDVRNVLFENTHGFAYMQFSGGYWSLHYQKQINPMEISSMLLPYRNGRLTKAPVRQPFVGESRTKRPASLVAQVKDFRIPYVSSETHLHPIIYS